MAALVEACRMDGGMCRHDRQPGILPDRGRAEAAVVRRFSALGGSQAEGLLDALIVAVEVVANLQRPGIVHPRREIGDVDIDPARQRNPLLWAADQLLQRGDVPALLMSKQRGGETPGILDPHAAMAVSTIVVLE